MSNYRSLSKEEFISNFGLLSKKVKLNEVPDFVLYSLSLNVDYVNDKVKADIPYYLRRCANSVLGQLEYILSHQYNEEILANFDIIKSKLQSDNVLLILKSLLTNSQNINFITNNMNIFLENASSKELEIEVINLLSTIEQCKRKLNNLETCVSKIPFFWSYVNKGTLLQILENNLLIEMEKYFSFYSGGDLSKVQYLSFGGTACIFRIGDFVLKIGRQRIKFDCKYSKYLLHPYVRKEYINGENVICTIEVQDMCDTTNITPEDTDNIYNSMLKEGSYWLDKAPENVFRLIKPNIRHIIPSEDGYKYEGDYEQPPLPPGQLVLGDTDWVFSTEDLMERHDRFDTVSRICHLTIMIDISKVLDIRLLLNNLLNQVYNDFEILINIPNPIVEEYMRLDNRIKRMPIEKAMGDYIIFDSITDFNDPYLLQRLYKELQANNNPKNLTFKLRSSRNNNDIGS